MFDNRTNVRCTNASPQFEPRVGRVKNFEHARVCLGRSTGASIAYVSEDKDPDFVESLEKGFRVIRAFDVTHAQMALSEVAARTGLSSKSGRRA